METNQTGPITIDPNTFKIRASYAGRIMAGVVGLSETQRNRKFELLTRKTENAKGNAAFKPLTKIMEDELARLMHDEANPVLPAGARTICELWVKQQLFNRRKEFTSKYTERGDVSEEQAIAEICAHLGIKAKKNDEYFSDEYKEGTPDCIPDDVDFLFDAKCPWDCFTFPHFEKELPEPDYKWQGLVYLDLVPGRKICKFVYKLIDTPENIVQQEAKTWCFKNGEMLRPEIVDEMRERLTYKNIDPKYKIKIFDVHKDDAAIEALHQRVIMCRQYIATIVI